VARWYSRRLGDALAWLLFLYERKTLFPFARNNRTPVSVNSDDDGTRGVEMTAQNLIDQKWGLPIMPDITDCLRIGDISLLSFGDSAEEHHVQTIEVTTTRTSTKPQPDGSDLITLQVRMIATEPFYQLDAAPPELLPAAPKKLRDDRRLDKQVEQMTRAMAYRDVENDVLAEVDGHPHMSLLTGIEDLHHWADLRRAIRQARKEGYAYFWVDDFIGYSVHYGATGITTQDLQRGDLTGDIVRTIFSDELGDKNSITPSHLPAKEDDGDTLEATLERSTSAPREG